MLTIDNVDDAEEMRITDDSFDVLGFTKVRLEWKSEGTETIDLPSSDNRRRRR